MATYSTLEEIKVDTQANPSSNNLIVLRSEQRDAIDQAKERFCKKTGRKGDYQYTVLPESRQFLWKDAFRQDHLRHAADARNGRKAYTHHNPPPRSW